MGGQATGCINRLPPALHPQPPSAPCSILHLSSLSLVCCCPCRRRFMRFMERYAEDKGLGFQKSG